MNNQDSVPNQTSSTNPPSDPSTNTYRGWREKRRAERWGRREAHWQRREERHTSWFAGVLLIGLGVILLLEQLNIPFVANWWALFILIPAFWAFITAWDTYQDTNRLTRRAAGSLTVGILLTILTLIFLLNSAVGFFWPGLLMAGGLALLVTALLPK
jgi:small-conductance mechanosensitive channel